MSPKIRNIFLLFFCLFSLHSFGNNEAIEAPEYILEGINSEFRIQSTDVSNPPYLLMGEGKIPFELIDEEWVCNFKLQEETTITVVMDAGRFDYHYNPIPLWLSVLPPLITILLALLFKEVISALFLGLFFGAFIIEFYQSGLILGLLFAFLRTMDTYLIEAMNDSGHLSVIIFSLLIGGMVSVISKNGGMQGVVDSISRFAKSPKSGQLSTWFLGIAIFFDDYANTLVVGKTMRPVTDRLKISREKLAYIVDSTAAPIASIALITTWIGAELGYIEDGIKTIEGIDTAVYSIFLNSLAYSYYPILALIFILIIIKKGKDFGPMLSAERLARYGQMHPSHSNREVPDELDIDKGLKANKWMAIIPILSLLIITIAGLFYSGWDQELWNSNESIFSKISTTIGNADSYKALLWGSAAGLVASIKLGLFYNRQSISVLIEHAMEGIKGMIPAIGILVLAWSLAVVIEGLHTADFLSNMIDGNLSPYLLPLFTFLLSALIAFSTGSSWGTMAILYPLILPLSWQVCITAGWNSADSLPIFYNVVSSVLAGSVLGDHCSPISDTTILSSLASDCDHIQHVRTQMPYALTVGAVASLLGTLPAAFGSPFWLNLPIAIAILWLIVHFFGQSTEDAKG